MTSLFSSASPRRWSARVRLAAVLAALTPLAPLGLTAGSVWGAETPQAMVTGMKYPESVCYGPKGLLYVTEIGEDGKDGDGKVSVIENGKTRTLAEGLDVRRGSWPTRTRFI